MTRLQPLQLENGAIVYIQTTEETPRSSESLTSEPSKESSNETGQEPSQELTRESLGKDSKGLRQEIKQAVQRAVSPAEIEVNETESAQPLKDTIRNYTDLIIGAFQEVATAEIKTLKLEFGVELGGKLNVPYIVSGDAKSTLKVSVECTFPSRADKPE